MARARQSDTDASVRERAPRAALELFAEHGVAGTSLQMIADRLGVAKAAVYHQYKTKDDIVLAVARPLIDELLAIIDAAELFRTDEARQDAMLTGLVRQVVAHRDLVTVINRDPTIGHLVAADPEINVIDDRIRALLAGPDPDPSRRVAVALTVAALQNLAVDDTVRDLDDRTIVTEILTGVRRLLPPPA